MLKKVANNIIASQSYKSIIQLVTGSIIAQLITIIVSPISTRLYTAEELGIYTLIITVLAMFGPVLCGKYDLLIVSAKDEKEVMELIVGSALFSLILIIIITIGYKFYLNTNSEITNEVGGFAYLVILLLIINGFINILTSYNNRYKDYKTISSVFVIRNAVQNMSLIILGLFKCGSVGLLFSQIFGSLFGLKKQCERLYQNRMQLKEVRFEGIKKVMVKYKKQPIFSMPAHFINSSSYSLLNFFISGLFGLDIFGYYSMSYRILGLPLTLVSMNVAKVFFQRATEEKVKTGQYYNTFKQITTFLTCIAIPMVAILIIFGPYMFELVFGEGWYISGIFVRIMAPMYGIRLIVSALTPALIISGKQKLEIIVQSTFIISSLTAYYVCRSYKFDIVVFLTIITISYTIIYIWFFITIFKISRNFNMQRSYQHD